MSEERGSLAPLLAAVIGVVLLLAAGLADAAVLLTARAEAQTAADAAALAAAAASFPPTGGGHPRSAAAATAAANGAVLVRCACPLDSSWSPRVVEVTVQRSVGTLVLGDHRIQAVAAARFDPQAWVEG